jgi:hypothetical protein
MLRVSAADAQLFTHPGQEVEFCVVAIFSEKNGRAPKRPQQAGRPAPG